MSDKIVGSDGENNSALDISVLRHRQHEKRQDRFEKDLIKLNGIVDELVKLANYYKVVATGIRKDVDDLHNTTQLLLNLVHGHVAQEEEHNLRRNKLILRLTVISGVILITLEAIHYAVTGQTVSASMIRELFAIGG